MLVAGFVVLLNNSWFSHYSFPRNAALLTHRHVIVKAKCWHPLCPKLLLQRHTTMSWKSPSTHKSVSFLLSQALQDLRTTESRKELSKYIHQASQNRNIHQKVSKCSHLWKPWYQAGHLPIAEIKRKYPDLSASSLGVWSVGLPASSAGSSHQPNFALVTSTQSSL